jgi:hypothetical protein
MPRASGTEAEAARAGGVGGHHAAHRRAGLGGIERQGPTLRACRQIRLQLAQRGAGQYAHGGRRRRQVQRGDATQPRQRDEVRRRVGHRAAGDARAGAAHGDRVSVPGVPAQDRPQLVDGGRLGHRRHAGRRQARLVAQQVGDLGGGRGEPEAGGRRRHGPGEIARFDEAGHVSRGCACGCSSAAP